MKLRPMKTARRLKIQSDAFEILGLTFLVALSVTFLVLLGLVSLAPFAVLILQTAILLAIYVFIRRCSRREYLAIMAAVKERIFIARSAMKG